MLVDEESFYPVWLYISAPMQHVDRVTATFRVMGVFGDTAPEREEFDGLFPCAMYRLFMVLDELLAHGPAALDGGSQSQTDSPSGI